MIKNLCKTERQFINENRSLIDDTIHSNVPDYEIDDRERLLWVMNDETLYLMARRQGVNI